MSTRKASGDYAVGYGKPPKHGQFRKGRSGNPKGRPKASRNVATMVRDALFQPIWITDGGVRRQITVLEGFLKRLVKGALEGDARSADRILKLLPLVEALQAEDAAVAAAEGAGTAAGNGDLEILRHFADLVRGGELAFADEEPEA